MSIHDQPTVKQELERKATDLLIETLHRFETGRLSAETAVTTAKTIWHCCSGLVDQEVTDLAQKLADEIPGRAESKSLYFFKKTPTGGTTLRIKYPTERNDYELFEPNSEMRQIVACEAGAERAAMMQSTIKTLVARGYRPL